jgi:hypothetical protein
MFEKKQFWKGDEGGLAHDCVIALIVGVGLFVLVIVAIYAAGYRLAGLPF